MLARILGCKKNDMIIYIADFSTYMLTRILWTEIAKRSEFTIAASFTTHAHKINRKLQTTTGQSSQWLQLLGFVKGARTLRPRIFCRVSVYAKLLAVQLFRVL